MTKPKDQAREFAGRHAADYVEDGMRVGLGTGSTVSHTIRALGEREADIECAATSEQTRRLAEKLGLTVRPADELGELDIAIDGADEVDPELNLIKGGGGAHTREKIVAEMAKRFIVVVDESKLVDELGAFGVPLEVLPFAPEIVTQRVRALGAKNVTTRLKLSDNRNLLLDAYFGMIADPGALGRELKTIPGLIEHGLFLGDRVERVIIGSKGGVREIVGASSRD
jgi:ribose 5-phosphate isomerase A